MTGMKDQKRPNTLIEYMGFKDEDLKTQTHDEIVLLLSEKINLFKIIKNILPNIKSIREITLEKTLSDDYKQYGFLDVYFEYDFGSSSIGFGFIEIKTKPESIGFMIREMEYYKTITQKLFSRRFDRDGFICLLVAPTKIPEHVRQFMSLTLENIKEILK